MFFNVLETKSSNFNNLFFISKQLTIYITRHVLVPFKQLHQPFIGTNYINRQLFISVEYVVRVS